MDFGGIDGSWRFVGKLYRMVTEAVAGWTA
jgi:hypothetical protein